MATTSELTDTSLNIAGTTTINGIESTLSNNSSKVATSSAILTAINNSASNVSSYVDSAISNISTLHSTVFRNTNYMVSNGFLYRMGSIVFMTYIGDFKDVPGGSFFFGQIIPTGYRPVDALAIGERNNGYLTLKIYADGNINCYNYNEQAMSLMNGQITACWITIDPYPTS